MGRLFWRRSQVHKSGDHQLPLILLETGSKLLGGREDSAEVRRGDIQLFADLDGDSPQVHSVEPKTPRTRGREATGQAHSSSPGCPRAAGEGLGQPEEAEGSSWVLGTAWQGDEEQGCWQWSRKRPSGNSPKPSM